METAEQFTACRTLGHAWDSIPVPLGEQPFRGVYLWLRCTRCAMIRKDEVDPNDGWLFRRHYTQPDGYARSADEYLPRDDWRKQYLRLIGVVGDELGARRKRAAS